MSVYRRILERKADCKAHEPKSEAACTCKLDSAWSVRVERKDRRTIRLRVGRHEDAVEKERELLVANDKGMLGKRSTLGQYVGQHWPIGDVSDSTARNEKSVLDAVLLPRFGKTQLSRVSMAAARDFRRDLGKKYAVATVNDYMRLLRKILRDANERGVLPVLPHWPKAEEEKLLRRGLSEKEQEALVAAFEDRRGFLALAGQWKKASRDAAADFERFRESRPLFVLAMETGLDLSDLLALKWERVGPKAIIGNRRKTGEEYSIGLSRRAMTALDECRKRRNVSGHVLLTVKGQPYSVITVGRYWRKAKKLAGIKRPCRFKDLRHTLGCNLVDAGLSFPMVAETLGHVPGSRVTARYARVDREKTLKAVREALDSRG